MENLYQSMETNAQRLLDQCQHIREFLGEVSRDLSISMNKLQRLRQHTDEINLRQARDAMAAIDTTQLPATSPCIRKARSGLAMRNRKRTRMSFEPGTAIPSMIKDAVCYHVRMAHTWPSIIYLSFNNRLFLPLLTKDPRFCEQFVPDISNPAFPPIPYGMDPHLNDETIICES